jgi:hypothetical protein
MTLPPAEREIYELSVSGDLDRHAAEALWLEVRRFARQHGVNIAVRVEKEPAGLPPSQ